MSRRRTPSSQCFGVKADLTGTKVAEGFVVGSENFVVDAGANMWPIAFGRIVSWVRPGLEP